MNPLAAGLADDLHRAKYGDPVGGLTPPPSDGGVPVPKPGVDLIRGSSEVPLSDIGRRQAQELARDLANKGIVQVITSPLQRTQETAQIIGQGIGARVAVDPDAMPWHLGGFEGQPTKKVLPEIQDLIKSRPDEIPQGKGPLSTAPGESFNQFKERVLTKFEQMLDDPQVSGVITHMRNQQLVWAWAKAGFPPDHTIDVPSMLEKGDPPGAMQTIRRDPNGQLKLEDFDPKMAPLQTGAGTLIMIRHGVTKWNAEYADLAKRGAGAKLEPPPG